jgi:hypothetical protein
MVSGVRCLGCFARATPPRYLTPDTKQHQQPRAIVTTLRNLCPLLT